MNKKIIGGIISFLFVFLSTQNSFAENTNIAIENPLGVNSIKEFLLSIISHLGTVLALVAVLFIILGGIFYITAGQSTERIKTAKNLWVGAIIGLVIALLAPTFIREVQEIFLPNKKLPTDISEVLPLKVVIANIIKRLLSIVGILAILSLVASGFTYIFSFGTSQSEKAKEMIKWSIVGLALSGASVIIVRQIVEIITQK